MEHDTPVDPQEFADFDAMLRHDCVETVKFALDNSDRESFELDDNLHGAIELYHWITEGRDVAFNCSDESAKFVSGQQRLTA